MTRDWRALGGVTRNDERDAARDGYAENSYDTHNTGITTYRIIDWSRAITLSFFWLLLSPVIVSLSVGAGFNRVVALLVCLLVLVSLFWTHFGGFVLDLEKDRLQFPVLLFRRTIRLSEIQDANAEYIHRSFKMNALDTPVNPKSEKDTVKMPIYAANLSGAFGARQVKFWSKKRRDQFLSHLREVAPGVCITRWW